MASSALIKACSKVRNKSIAKYKEEFEYSFKWSDLIGDQLQIREMINEGVRTIFALNEYGRIYILEMKPEGEG